MDDKAIRKHALKNAVLHDGKARVKSVIPKVLGEEPKLKKKLKTLTPKIKKIVDKVNNMKIGEQKKELLKLDKHALDKKEEKKELPEIEDIKKGKCSFRLPPGPEKQLHIGHALSFLLNDYYAKKYKGELYLRFEDTNPEKCRQEFVDGIKEDLKKLGISWDYEVYLSDNMRDYYKLCDKLIKEKNAYSCSCSSDKITQMRKKHKRCDCAKKSVTETLRDWNKMKYGTHREGAVVIRLKADMKSKNSVMWDPVIFRISKTKHYRQGNKHKAWPLYDFTAAVEDAKITHVLRDANWTQRIELQDFIREKLGIKNNPKNILFSRYEVQGGVTKGRVIRELVKEGKVTGYDDPRLMTVKGLLRRGILPEALLELLKDVGISKSKTTIPLKKLYAINKSLLEPKAKHYFFVKNPILVKVTNGDEFYIPKEDAKKGVIRLKDNYNINIEKISKECSAKKLDKTIIENVLIIQWVKKENAVETKILEPKPLFDKKGNFQKNSLIIHEGVTSKKASELEVGTQVQFERFGFCKKEENQWIFTHK